MYTYIIFIKIYTYICHRFFNFVQLIRTLKFFYKMIYIRRFAKRLLFFYNTLYKKSLLHIYLIYFNNLLFQIYYFEII